MRNQWTSAFVCIFCLMSVGCEKLASQQRHFSEIKLNEDVSIHSCEAYSSLASPSGELQNNVWNAHSAKDYPWEQCIGSRTNEGKKQYGWIWHWPSNGDAVYAQPQITLGYSPWLNHQSVSESFPIAADSLQRMTVSYDLEMSFQGELNLTSTLWLTTSPSILEQVDKNTIAVEMMIWTYSTDGFYTNPAGEKVAEVSFNGTEWEVWLDRSWHDTSGVNSNNWVYLAFRSKENFSKISFDLSQMLKFSRKNGYIDEHLYIADIQLGNEVMSGVGQTWIKNYKVEF